MAWTQSDLDAIDAALAKGVKRVQYDNQMVEYHSLDELLKLRDLIANTVGNITPPPRTVGVYASGLQGSFLIPGGRRCR